MLFHKIQTFSSYLISGNVSSDKLFRQHKKKCVCIKTSALNAQYEMVVYFFMDRSINIEKRSLIMQSQFNVIPRSFKHFHNNFRFICRIKFN